MLADFLREMYRSRSIPCPEGDNGRLRPAGVAEKAQAPSKG